jgi:hypothetical protein
MTDEISIHLKIYMLKRTYRTTGEKNSIYTIPRSITFELYQPYR